MSRNFIFNTKFQNSIIPWIFLELPGTLECFWDWHFVCQIWHIRCQFNLFFPWIWIWPQNRKNIINLLSKKDPEVCFLYLENCHRASKVICFKTIHHFPIWAFQRWIIFLFFQKINIWVKGYFRMEKNLCMQKNQHLTFKIICFRTISYCLQHSVFSMMFHIFIFSKNRYLSKRIFQNEKASFPEMKSVP